MANRKKAEAFILQLMKDIDPTGYNVEQWKKIFADLTDRQFDEYMKGLRDGTKFLVFFKPAYKAQGITEDTCLATAEKYGIKLFEKLVYTNNPDEPDHKTAIEYLILEMPYRRQSQTMMKKISVPDNNKVIDQMTYQPTGPSKGSKISYPELRVLLGMNMDNAISELIKYRGGDKGGFNAYNAMAMRYGSVRLKTIEPYRTGTESTKTVKIILNCMHIKHTL
ncbi:MAG: hypothetical protein PHN51_11995 [Candidatus Nanopelagicales bacterium]|nr:hypothetical protein [Candidatus Nanopelagicales bacterium]